MSTGGESNQDQSENSHPSNTPIHVTGVYPFWNASNTNIQHHGYPAQFDYTNAYNFSQTSGERVMNMSFLQPSMPIPPSTNIYYPHLIQPHQQSSQLTDNPVHQMNPQPTPQSTHQPTPQNTHQPSPQPTPAIFNPRGNKNWTMTADLQLTIAYCRIMTEPSVGVNQSKDTLWERVLQLFKQLIKDDPMKKPEDFTRNSKACENRMGEIKNKCSIWTGVRTLCLGLYKSGWSSQDMDKLCLDQYLQKVKKPFKFMECWKVLKEHPKWHEYVTAHEKNVRNTNRATVGPRANKRVAPSSDPDVHEPMPNVSNETMDTSSPYNTSLPLACTPNLDGPASIEIERPPGMKKSKANNQRHGRFKQHAESEASASQSLTANLMRLDSSSTANWEKSLDETRRMNKLDEEFMLDMKRQKAEIAHAKLRQKAEIAADNKHKNDLGVRLLFYVNLVFIIIST